MCIGVYDRLQVSAMAIEEDLVEIQACGISNDSPATNQISHLGPLFGTHAREEFSTGLNLLSRSSRQPISPTQDLPKIAIAKFCRHQLSS
jgi:hypothetical protein